MKRRKIIAHVLEYWPFYMMVALLTIGIVGRLTDIIPAG